MNLVRRSVEPNPDLTAAWGNPPVTLRCGVPEPKTLTPTSKLIAVDNVDWLPEKRSNGYVFTTIGRVANVEVSVPQDYEPETQALIELSGAVKSADPLAPA